nr:quinol:cytochrome C oxidoreductase [uncultured Flavobacterium sp.]
MYTFSSKLKTFSFVLMAVGILGIGYGFLTAPKNIQEVEALLAADSHGGHGEGNHEAVASAHGSESAHEAVAPEHGKTEAGKHDVKADTEHQEHLEHVFHQLSNKPWAAFYVACIFFMLLSLGTLAFYAIQQVAQAGWSPVLFRVMQGITAYLPVGSVIFFIFLVLCGLHLNHLFIWLDPEVVKHDELIQTKSGFLNFPFWIVRAAIFLAGWNAYRYFSRKNCLAQDESNDNSFYKKNFNYSAGFLVFFIVTESIMSWDWIMSIDPHWFSTLFGWYVFASFFVSGITMICMVTVYLKSRGYLEHVNTSHIHDLAKFMFGISVFWTYLWFSQFMLIWYANIPEEITYFITRIQEYNLPFFGAVVMNFLFPVLILINTDFKRITWILVMAGIVILLGHYIDFFNMIMPGTVGSSWFIGVPEIASVLFFLGLFIFVVFSALTKAPLLAKRNPFIEESKHFHY